MLKHELALVWITSDGTKFLKKEDAKLHEIKFQEEKSCMERLKNQWFSNEG
jgi:hypothetical protein|tara:strand:- start:188 stop:340 length:153 start_codon:yes stop_codon:yes gene_type:complete